MKVKDVSRFFPFVVAGLLAFVLGLISFQLLQNDQNNQTSQIQQLEVATVLPYGRPIKPFQLLQHNGEVFDNDFLQEKFSLIFFGFTNCPDICPSTLHEFTTVKKILKEQQLWEQFRVIFVTVDPARDTVEKMSQYVPYFDPEFIGVTGSEKAISDFAASLSMPFQAEQPDERGFYNVDHSATVLLIDDKANLAALISPPFTPKTLVADLKSILQR